MIKFNYEEISKLSEDAIFNIILSLGIDPQKSKEYLLDFVKKYQLDPYIVRIDKIFPSGNIKVLDLLDEGVDYNKKEEKMVHGSHLDNIKKLFEEKNEQKIKEYLANMDTKLQTNLYLSPLGVIKVSASKFVNIELLNLQHTLFMFCAHYEYTHK